MSASPDLPWYKQRGHFMTGFILHCLTGVIAVAVHYGLMYLCLQLAFSPLASTCVGFAGGALTRFIMAYYHIFEPSSGVPLAAARFSATLALQFVGNAAIFALLISLSVPVWPAQILTTVSLTVLNYLVYRYWVFT